MSGKFAFISGLPGISSKPEVPMGNWQLIAIVLSPC